MHDSGLTPNELQLLRLMFDDMYAQHQGKALARALGLPLYAMYMSFNRLEELGWVSGEWRPGTRDPVTKSPAGRYYRLTELGIREYRATIPPTQMN